MVGGASRGRRRGFAGRCLWQHQQPELQQRVGGINWRDGELRQFVGERDHHRQHEQGDGPGQRQGPHALLVRDRHPDLV
jgi:hypothetical protein